jgi:hypothetical protein
MTDEKIKRRHVPGTITNLNTLHTKEKQMPWARGLLKVGEEEIVFVLFPKGYSQLKHLFASGAELAVSGSISRPENRPEELIVADAHPAQKAP